MTTEKTNDLATEIPQLTDDDLTEARRLIGVPLRREHFRWNEYVTQDAIRHYCYGISDTNPLWLDPDYARTTRWKDLIPPPTFLYSIDRGHAAPGLPAVQWIYGGIDWRFDRPPRLGEYIESSAQLVDAKWVAGRHADRMILQEGEIFYKTADGEPVGNATTHMFRIPRARAGGGLSYEKREPHKYSPEDMEKIEAGIDAEEVRGSEPRYWEDVNAGDHLIGVVKGPLNLSDLLMFYAGGGCFFLAHEMAFKWRRRHPADVYTDAETGIKDHPGRGHIDDSMASEVGMPGRYDSGLQRVAWMGQVATDWMGDDAELKTLSVRLRRPNVFGDTHWCTGTVKAKREVGGACLVDVELRGINQRDETTTEGSATVELPSRTR